MEMNNLKEKALSDEGWKKVEGSSNVWKPEKENEEITGTYTKKVQEDGNWGLKNKYTIVTDEGEKVIYGTTGLDELFNSVDLGEEVLIIYKGESPSKPPKKPFKLFEMYHKPTAKSLEMKDDPEARTTIDIIKQDLIGQGIRDPTPQEIIDFAEKTSEEYDPDAITRIKAELARQLKIEEGNSDE